MAWQSISSDTYQSPPSMPTSGFGKGAPPSAMFGKGAPHSAGMPGSFVKGKGKGPVYGSGSFGKGLSQMVPGPPPPLQAFEVDKEETFWDRLWSLAAEDEDNHAAYPAPQFVSIPWQQPRPPKEEPQAQPHTGFDALEIEQLQVMATSRDHIIESLEKEIEELEQDDAKHEERLSALERQFGSLTQGDAMKVRAPLLAKISKVVHESHLLDHEEAMNGVADGGENSDDRWDYLHAQNLTMGRGYMQLDRKFIAKQEMNEQLERDQHPVVNRLHYAGHIANPAHQVESVFVKEAGIMKRHAVYPTPYRNQFWLSLDGPTIDEAHAAREAEEKAMEDPVFQRIVRQDVAGAGADARAVDWLGKLKRGEVIDEIPSHDPGFVMPRWMY